jgi:nucleotide sugar dehydrogenase
VGGHCIPVDPVYLTTRAARDGFTFTLVEAATRVNEHLPTRVVNRAETLLGDLRGSCVLLLGVTYKADVPDVRESPARPIAAQLLARGAEVGYHDPHAAGLDVDDRPLRRETDLRAAAAAADLTILLQDHRDYDLVLLANASRLLLDTRGKASGSRVRHL